ncbi:MAG: dihydroxyacetone kinase subunit DhaL [Bacillota bacterium]
MRTLTVDQATDMVISACDAIIENKPYLTEVDSKIGDGDHGIGMAGGMERAKTALTNKRPFPDINSIFRTTGMEMLNSMGGASGVIFGTLFLGGVKNLEPVTELDGNLIARMMRNSLESIKERGKAQPGDKTMVDALEPAVIAMENGNKEDLVQLLSDARNAAWQGVENTKNYIAKFGKAKTLQQRAIGFQDAGATSVAIIFDGMYNYVKGIGDQA